MASFLSFFTDKKIPSPKKFWGLLRGNLTTTRVFVLTLFALLLGLIFTLAIHLHNKLLISTPSNGGTVRIGEIGTIKTTNPLLVTTELESAISKLIYAGLLKKDASGDIIPELAEKYEISPDGKTYTLTLKKVYFHNKKAVTTEDILFTYMKIKEGVAGQKLAAYFGPVQIEAPDATTIIFTLPESRPDFLENLTIGILPSNIWSTLTNEEYLNSKYSITGIGAGSFKAVKGYTTKGIPTKLVLKKNKRYTLQAPYIQKVVVTFFTNQNDLYKAVAHGKVDVTTDLTPETLSKNDTLKRKIATAVPTKTTASLYYLKSASGTLSDPSFIQAIDILIDKRKIISIVENEYGALDATPEISEDIRADLKTLGYTLSETGVLLKNGKTLGVSIATANDPLTTKLVQTFANELRSFGITVSIQSFDPGIFNTELSKRNFSAVLVRGTKEPNTAYKEIYSLYRASTPFITSKYIHNITPEELSSQKSYYENIAAWYINTEKLYPVFIKH